MSPARRRASSGLSAVAISKLARPMSAPSRCEGVSMSSGGMTPAPTASATRQHERPQPHGNHIPVTVVRFVSTCRTPRKLGGFVRYS